MRRHSWSVIFCRGAIASVTQRGAILSARSTLTDLSQALPEFAIAAMREAIPAFDKQIKGLAMPDAVLTGIET